MPNFFAKAAVLKFQKMQKSALFAENFLLPCAVQNAETPALPTNLLKVVQNADTPSILTFFLKIITIFRFLPAKKITKTAFLTFLNHLLPKTKKTASPLQFHSGFTFCALQF